MKQNQIDLVRRFNRAVTQRIGALDDAYRTKPLDAWTKSVGDRITQDAPTAKVDQVRRRF